MTTDRSEGSLLWKFQDFRRSIHLHGGIYALLGIGALNIYRFVYTLDIAKLSGNACNIVIGNTF